MRHIMVDEARRLRAAKRGGDQVRVPLYESQVLFSKGTISDDPLMDLEALDNALNELADSEEGERMCKIVELRFFVGLTLEQTAEVMGISLATVKRCWENARARLCRAMKKAIGDET
jgi:RNA polymerase sigma factor (TIGR02999 family)